MKKDPKIFLDHVLDSIELVEEYTDGKSKSDFLENIELQDAIVRRIEIIGEAIKNIPEEIKDKYSDVKWKQIAGTRDILVHVYFGIDLDLTWEVVVTDLPKLKKQITQIKNEMT